MPAEIWPLLTGALPSGTTIRGGVEAGLGAVALAVVGGVVVAVAGGGLFFATLAGVRGRGFGLAVVVVAGADFVVVDVFPGFWAGPEGADVEGGAGVVMVGACA